LVANKEVYRGFTIVELLIVIVVIAILAAITVVAYNGIQQNANNTRRMNDIKAAGKAVELYFAQHGSYPTTGSAATDVRTDSNCSVGTRTNDWIPNVVPQFVSVLPQSDGKSPNGTNTGCYKYWSNGTSYLISAWIAVEGGSQTSTMYRRAGFREAGNGASEQYYCNHTSMGGMGAGAGPYNVNNDLYKKSYTLTSPTIPANGLVGTCNETPPAGA
jgi:prepilin-type N-terminal cleavage/methylation domain-containing protein